MRNTKRSFREKRRKAEKFWKSVLFQYCENTSLHGFRHVVSRDSTIVEKLLWLLVCLFGICFAIVMMLLVWSRFRETPTVTTIETTTHPIFSLNFPAVSICNYNKVYKPHADKFSERMRQRGLNETEIDNFFSSLPKLIRPDYVEADNTRAMELMTSSDYTIEDIMYDMMQPCENLLLRCSWEGKTHDCNKIFKPTKSTEGFCCTFNYHVNTSEDSMFGVRGAEKTWDFKQSMMRDIEKEPGVFKVLSVPGAGRDVGLSVVLNLESESYFGSIRPSLGASILVHDPFNYPEVEVLTSFIQPTQEIAMILSASIVESNPSVRNLALSQRNCWFSDEKKLNISPVYSYQSCITECRIRHIRRYCKCLPFYYPNYYHEKVCSLSDIDCLTKYRGSLSNLRTIIDLAMENNTDNAECECLPSCNDNTYTSNSENQFMANVSSHLPILENFNVMDVSLASIYFRGITCLKYRKETWMTWDTVIASFGGIFGLCVGGSFVSLVEFFYYFANKIFHKQEVERTNIPQPRAVFRAAKINTSVKWFHQNPDNRDSNGNGVLSKQNNSSMQKLRSEAPKLKLEEEFIKHFFEK